MKNTSGLTRAERKAAKKAKKQLWMEQYKPYWLNVRCQSRAGIVYYKLVRNKHGLTPVYDEDTNEG